MAEIKTGIFAKNVQKRLNRAQEKVLQKLGKADETKDEQFEQVVINFRRQESEGSRLQREMRSYMSAIKGMQQASINLTQSLHEVYEPDWHGKDDVMTIGKDCDALWEDFHNKLVDSTLLNLDAYLQQFPDLKNRVAKRSRKLIDYDSARHHVETLQTSGMKNDRKMMKAEDELKKAQRVFDELNVGLQDELPTLWDSRVGFYISTYKSVTNLEAKFHREISLVCRQLYEVMTQLAEQHSDKMFTIQGAPSDSGPLRLARTPSPPEDESPPESPDASSNHMLRPVSPGPPRPKSPIQLKKGPPVPPPPKVTPTKEVAEEQIIDLFGGEFLPAPSPSQPNERPGESLLDMDFDAFQPDESVSPIPQTAVPWDMWSANAQPVQPAADTSFVADWSADFGSATANGDAASGAEAPTDLGAPTAPGATAAGPEGAEGRAQSGAQGWPQGDSCQPGGDAPTLPHPQDSEAAIAPEDEVSSRDHNPLTYPNLHPSAVGGDEAETEQVDSGGDVTGKEDRRKSTPGLIFTNEYGEQIQDSTEDRGEKWSRSPDGSGSEYETAEEWGDGGQGGDWASADDELSYEDPPQRGDVAKSRIDGEATDQPQTVSADKNINCLAEDKPPEKQPDLTSPSETQGGVFDSDPFAETQGGGAFDSDPFAETQGGGAFDSDPFAETQGGGAFDSDPFAETQGGDAFDSDPFAETQGGGAFDSDPFAETQGGGAFDSDPFAKTQGGGAFDSDPFAETQGGGAFDSDPFAETQGGGAFDSDPSAETQGGGAFDSDPSAETQGGGAFDSDPSAETQGGGAFDSDPFAETQGGGAFDSDPFAETQFGDRMGGFKCDPFAETSGEGDVVAASDGRTGWDTDPFANSLPAAPSDTEGPATNTTSWQEVSNNIGFYSSVTQENSASFSGTAAQGIKDVSIPRIHKEPENSDMSEDEAANRRFGKLYQELDTEKEEVNKEFNGFSQDAAAPSFFADFDKMNEASETQAAAVTEPVEPQEEPAAPPAGEVEEPAAPPAGEVEQPAAPPTGEEDTAESSGSPKEEKLATPSAEEAEISPNEAAPSESVSAPEEKKESPVDEASEKMPIPSVVIEPASSNEGDDDRDADIISPTTISDNGVTAENQTIKHMSPSGGVSGLPDDFLYKVETIHDFEAANSDELELKRGDVVLVVPTASVEDQDAGWLTGIKENDWLTLGAGAEKGLFPENFTQRLE
ncbi:amphiphysin isoform X3 [Thunnus thynnus]|uniref:amphiphysin isoform X3 n=1 Tax=Thunnus thynnus TaxID=8237 RepID=UPI003529729A